MAQCTAWRAAKADITRAVLAEAAATKLAEPVAQGLVRDVQTAVSSYIGLRAGGHEAQWPTPGVASVPDHAAALAALAAAVDWEQENAARDALATVARLPGCRPLLLARERDARLVRTGPAGAIALVLNVQRASARDTRRAIIRPGVDAASGEAIEAPRYLGWIGAHA